MRKVINTTHRHRSRGWSHACATRTELGRLWGGRETRNWEAISNKGQVFIHRLILFCSEVVLVVVCLAATPKAHARRLFNIAPTCLQSVTFSCMQKPRGSNDRVGTMIGSRRIAAQVLGHKTHMVRVPAGQKLDWGCQSCKVGSRNH